MVVQAIIPSLSGYFISMKTAKKRKDLLLKTSFTHTLPVRIKP
jgi:hypothetical protein